MKSKDDYFEGGREMIIVQKMHKVSDMLLKMFFVGLVSLSMMFSVAVLAFVNPIVSQAASDHEVIKGRVYVSGDDLAAYMVMRYDNDKYLLLVKYEVSSDWKVSFAFSHFCTLLSENYLSVPYHIGNVQYFDNDTAIVYGDAPEEYVLGKAGGKEIDDINEWIDNRFYETPRQEGLDFYKWLEESKEDFKSVAQHNPTEKDLGQNPEVFEKFNSEISYEQSTVNETPADNSSPATSTQTHSSSRQITTSIECPECPFETTDGFGKTVYIESFKITDIKPLVLNDGDVEVCYEIVGSCKDDGGFIMLYCYDKDGFVCDKEMIMASSGDDKFKLKGSLYVSKDTVRIAP